MPLAQMTLFICSSAGEQGMESKKSLPYTVSRSTSLGQAPWCVRFLACSSSLAMHERTSTLPFLSLAPSPSGHRQPRPMHGYAGLAHTRAQTGRAGDQGGSTRTGARTCVAEWRQDPRRHVTGAPLLCRREFAPDEAALRQQTSTGVSSSRQAPVVLSNYATYCVAVGLAASRRSAIDGAGLRFVYSDSSRLPRHVDGVRYDPFTPW